MRLELSEARVQVILKSTTLRQLVEQFNWRISLANENIVKTLRQWRLIRLKITAERTQDDLFQ